MLIGILVITPLSIAKETRQPLVPEEESDFEALPEGGIRSGISENLNSWEVEGERENDYEYPLEPDSTQTKPSFAPNNSDNNWLDGDPKNPRQRSDTIPFIKF